MRTFEEYIKEKEPTLLHNLKQFDLWKFIDKLNTNYIAEIEQVKKLNIDGVSNCYQCSSKDTEVVLMCTDCGATAEINE